MRIDPKKIRDWVVLIGIPILTFLYGRLVYQQNKIAKSQKELIRQQKELTESTIEAKNAQIEYLQSLRSDILVNRLIASKENYEKDIISVQKKFDQAKKILDSAGIPITNNIKTNTLKSKSSLIFKDNLKNKTYALTAAAWNESTKDTNRLINFAGETWVYSEIKSIPKTKDSIHFYNSLNKIIENNKSTIATFSQKSKAYKDWKIEDGAFMYFDEFNNNIKLSDSIRHNKSVLKN